MRPVNEALRIEGTDGVELGAEPTQRSITGWR